MSHLLPTNLPVKYVVQQYVPGKYVDYGIINDMGSVHSVNGLIDIYYTIVTPHGIESVHPLPLL